MTPTDAPVFDPFCDDYFDDPSAMYTRLRDEAPVSFNEQYGFYAIARFDDVAAACLDWKTFSSEFGVDLSMLRTGRRAEHDLVIMMDPPKHDRLRALVSRVFTPRAVNALEPMIREVIEGYADELDGRPSFDAVDEFSALFPVEIISRMLGVPPDDRQQIRHWLDIGLRREHGSADPTPEGMEAMLAAGVYFYELILEKRANPGDDMLSRLTQVEVDRGDGQLTALEDTEIAGFASLLGGAGAETVTKWFGNAVVLFARHPDQWAKVLADRSLVPGAVEEVLRYHPPSQYQGRFSVAESVVGGVTIPAGYPVLLLTGAATHDERAFDDPDRFDIERPASLSLAFGYGIHSCVGAALARMECRIALELLADRWPDYRIDEDGLRRVQMSNVAGYSHVPVRL